MKSYRQRNGIPPADRDAKTAFCSATENLCQSRAGVAGNWA
jgi:hypothetical protein